MYADFQLSAARNAAPARSKIAVHRVGERKERRVDVRELEPVRRAHFAQPLHVLRDQGRFLHQE